MSFYFVFIFLLYMLFTIADYKWPNRWQRKILIALPCIILFFVAIFRFDVGYDYPAYYDISAEESERFERISLYFVDITNYLNAPYVIFILFGIPTYLCAFWAFTKAKSFQIAFWVYIFLFLLESFGTIRQAAAMSIMLCGIVLLRKKKMLLYFLTCILASMLHTTALIMLPAYFIYHYFSWKFTLLSLIVMTLSFPYLISMLIEGDMYTFYLKNMDIYEGGSLIRYFYILLYLFLLALAYKFHLLKNLKPIFITLLPAFFFPFILGGHFGGRLSSYYYLLFIFLIPEVISYCKEKLKMLFMLALCAFFFAVLYVSQRAGDKSPYTPYQTIFEVDLDHPIFKE